MSRTGVRIFTLALIVGAGCSRMAPASRDFAAFKLPESGIDPTPFVEPLKHRLGGITTFRAGGIVRFERANDPIRQMDFRMLAGPHEQLRLRGTRAIGPVLFELIANEHEFTFTIPIWRKAYTGVRGPEENAAHVLVPSTITNPLHVRLQPSALRYVVHGGEHTNLVELVRDDENGPWRIAQRIAFDHGTGRVSKVTTFSDEGGPLLITTFGDYRQLPETGPEDTFPFSIVIERPSARSVVHLFFKEVEPNVEIPAAAFDPTPPAGYQVAPAAEFDPDDIADEPELAG